MMISNQQNNIYNNYTQQKPVKVNFTANPDAEKLAFKTKDFFIRIRGYGKNKKWAEKVIEATDNTVKELREGKDYDVVLSDLAKGMGRASQKCDEFAKQYYSGILRVDRPGYNSTGEVHKTNLRTEAQNQYKSYKKRLHKRVANPLPNPYPNISLTKIIDENKNTIIIHGDKEAINNALDMVNKLFNGLKIHIEKPEQVSAKNLDEINSTIAEIRWIMAHATPWERGSDAIANSFVRALYKSMGIKTYQSKRGLSFDLQAYCTPLEEYKENFSSYFRKKPKVME